MESYIYIIPLIICKKYESEKYVIFRVIDFIWLRMEGRPQGLIDTDIVSRSAKPCLYRNDTYNTNNNELNEE